MNKIAQISSSSTISVDPINECIDAVNTLGKDYITSWGTSGNWTYRKWASGLAECWCRCTSASSSQTNDCNITGDFPFTFSKTPMIQASGQANGSQDSYIMYSTVSTSSFSVGVHSSFATNSFTAFIYVNGVI